MFNQFFISVSKVFQKCFENDSKVFVSLSVLKLFVRIEVIAATRALGGLVYEIIGQNFATNGLVHLFVTPGRKKTIYDGSFSEKLLKFSFSS